MKLKASLLVFFASALVLSADPPVTTGSPVLTTGNQTVAGVKNFTGTVQVAGVALGSAATHAAAEFQPIDADLTALGQLSGTNTIYYRSAANTWTAVTIGGNLSFIGGTLNGNAGVSSVGMTVPSGLSVSPSTITTSGVFAVTTSLNGILMGNGSGFTTATAGTNYLAPTGSGAGLTGITASQVGAQPSNSDLAAIAALSGTGYAKRTGSGTWALDTSTFLTANQTITLSGDVSGSGTTAITVTIGAGKVTNSMVANGTIDLTTKITGLLPKANGGTGTATPTLSNGTHTNVTGTWPNQTVNLSALTSADVGLDLVDNVSLLNWHGSSNLDTLGVIIAPLLVSDGGSTTTLTAGGLRFSDGVHTATVNVDVASDYTATMLTSASPVAWGALSGIPVNISSLAGITVTTGLLKHGSGSVVIAAAGTDYVAPGGALATPSSGTLTNCGGLPISGISGLGSGIATFLAATKPTTLTGYGITDGQPLNAELTSLSSSSGLGYAHRTGSGTWVISSPRLDNEVAGILPVTSGGTGTGTPALVNGTRISITGTWPNQTINVSGLLATDVSYAPSGTNARTVSAKFSDFVWTPYDFGAVGVGTTHPLSGVYGSLGAAQAFYSFTFPATTASSTTVTCVDTTGLQAGWPISGTGIPANTTISTITDGQHFVISAAATSSISVTLTSSFVTSTAQQLDWAALQMCAYKGSFYIPEGGFYLGTQPLRLVQMATAGGQINVRRGIVCAGAGPQMTTLIAAADAIHILGRYQTVSDLSIYSTAQSAYVGIQTGEGVYDSGFNINRVEIFGFRFGVDNTASWDDGSITQVAIRDCGTAIFTLANQDWLGIRAANISATQTKITLTACTASSSTTVATTSTTNLWPGMVLQGTGTSPGAAEGLRVISVTDATHFVVDAAVTLASATVYADSVALGVSGTGRASWIGGVGGGCGFTIHCLGAGATFLLQEVHAEACGGVFIQAEGNTTGEINSCFFADGGDPSVQSFTTQGTSSVLFTATNGRVIDYARSSILCTGGGEVDVNQFYYSYHYAANPFHTARPDEDSSGWPFWPVAAPTSEGKCINQHTTAATTAWPYDGNILWRCQKTGASTWAYQIIAGMPAGSYPGTITNNDAPAGYIGEFVSTLVASGSPVSLTTATATNVASISLTAGDWDVGGNINFSNTGSAVTSTQAGISATSATLPTDGSECYSGVISAVAVTEIDTVTVPRKRISVASTTTIYLVGKSAFSIGTMGAFGSINARRVR